MSFSTKHNTATRKRLASHLNIRNNKVCSLTLSILMLLISFNASSHSENTTEVSSTPMIRLKMNGLTNSFDETVIYYQTGASDGFDNEYDAYKLFGPTPGPHISQEYNSTLMAINGVAPVVETFSMNIRATTHITGNFTITATDINDLPKGTCAYLHDLVTGSVVDILANPYSFTLSDTTSNSRFVLSITHYQLAILSDLTQPTCQLFDHGKFKLTGINHGPWNYVWKDSAGTIIKTILNSHSSDSLENLSDGNYVVEITTAGNSCYYKDTTFSINPIILPNVNFTSPNTTVFSSFTNNYTTINQSINCQTYHWDFGDGTSKSSDIEPPHCYSVAGQYKAKLVGISSTGCVDSVQKSVNVVNLATSVMTELTQNIKVTDMGNKQFKITSEQSVIDELFVNVVDLKGATILKQKHNLNGKENLLLNLEGVNTGMYILSIGSKDNVLKSLKIIVE